MNEITQSGNGLNIVIVCRPIPLHNWLAFISWRSIRKFLPDAAIMLACSKEEKVWGVFRWVYQANIKMFRYTAEDDTRFSDQLKISAYTFAIRECDPDNLGPVPVRNDDSTTFVDCSQGCGKFVVSDWIDKARPPVSKSAIATFGNDDLTPNEGKVLRMWDECKSLYIAMQ